MSGEQNYYQLLGIEPTADQAAIDAAYQSRSLRFRLGQLRDRARALPGPTQEEVEQAYAVLGDPESRALYDAAYFPEKGEARRRRRVPVWLLAATAGWVLLTLVVCVLGARSRLVDDGGAIGRFINNATATAPASVVAAAATETPTAPPSAVPPTVAQAAASPMSTVPPPPPTVVPPPTVPPPPTTSVAPSSPGLTFRPTETAVSSPTSVLTPTSTATRAATAVPTAPPSAAPPTVVPPPTPVPPTPTPVPPPEPTTPPPPPPTPTPSFPATDRIGTAQPVNLRAGPGTNFAILRALPQGTLLRATGESAFSGGFLWRRFQIAGGGDGWVRDIDVLPVR